MMSGDRSLIEELYKDVILEHSRRPHHFREIENADRVVDGHNPLCGDRITLYIRFDESGKCIEEIGFKGVGCAICNASASMMTDAVQKHTVDEALHTFDRFRNALMSPAGEELPDELIDELGELAALTGVRRLPMRVKCATLAWHALREALCADEQSGPVSTE